MIEYLRAAVTGIPLISGYDIHFQYLVSNWVIIMVVVALSCFIVSEISRNYSQVDKLWSLMPIIYSWVTVASFPSARVYIMATLVTIWGLRLSYNFGRKGGYSFIPWKGAEDYRWQVMRDNPVLKGRFRFGLFNLFFISFYQNILILLFSSPLLIAARHAGNSITVLDAAATLFMLLFIITEGIADTQLFRFHQQKRGIEKLDGRFTESLKKGFMVDGLWRYVRHPNFASEQAIWISFYFFGVAASGKWLNPTISGSVLLVLLFIGSTILTERISSSKYPDYKQYQKDKPKFIPDIRRR
ncbi:MAG: DUF1295 domain-containing protein [Bacteroidales bacterium]|jgi:steroid 5-alpha reductase family enzyme|nr:DUF1295 domain-containing protein [Bacteroidales bacterium]